MCVCLLSRERKVYVPELRAQPAEVGKIGLYQALGRAFKHVFSNPEDANHNGPEYGKVVQEGGHLTAQSDHEQIPHLHGAAASPRDHRWKAIEIYLRVHEKIKATVSGFLGILAVGFLYIGSMQLVCT